MPYHETQPSPVIRIVVGAAAVLVFVLLLVVPPSGPPDSRNVVYISLSLALLVHALILWKMHSLKIDINEQTVAFGFPPVVCRIPVREITAVRIVKLGFLNAGGWGIRWTIGGRWNYVAALGAGVEIDWGKKKRGFSTARPEEIKAILERLCPGKVTDQRQR